MTPPSLDVREAGSFDRIDGQGDNRSAVGLQLIALRRTATRYGEYPGSRRFETARGAPQRPLETRTSGKAATDASLRCTPPTD